MWKLDENPYPHVTFAFAVGIALSLISGLVLSGQITQPIWRLRNTIKHVTRSHYQIRAPEAGSREMKDLTRSFNRLIDELEDQEKLRQELLADVTHELKTPITKIRGQVEGMLDRVYELSPENLNRVVANVHQLEYLIQALYEVNRLTPQDVVLTRVRCPVKELVDEAVSGYTGKPVVFIVHVSGRLKINADRNRLRQVIDNLINNAYKYTSVGTITVTADTKHLVVTDTGSGIAPEHVPNIFQRLYRADKSRSRQTGGLGLGLYIVKQLVTLHGWTIGVTSEVGQGSTFTVTWG